MENMVVARDEDIAFLMLRRVRHESTFLVSLKQEPPAGIASEEGALIAAPEGMHQAEEALSERVAPERAVNLRSHLLL
jgi:hypothetical protein